MNLADVQNFWARALGVRGPQWMIIMALHELERGKAVPVAAVAEMLHVDAAFVTTQSRLLCRRGFVWQIEDDEVVFLSLTDKARKHLAELTSRQI
ncbi:hypothetical protein [Bradyrhizobium sp. STM 3562]|uniref:hypothetical protein n=1 Tax=Bradyrhizobium sp. STM 3562 TaxID=578924 RepID=UPI0038905BCB